MRRLALPLALTAALVAWPASLHAQSRDEPSLAFTISGGLNAGRDLWQVGKQVLRSPSGQTDTATITRRIRPGLTATLGVSYFRSSHFGVNAEIAFYGLGTEQDCKGPASFSPDTTSFNQAVCTGINGAHISSNIAAFQVGATYRFLDPQRVSPYVRANVGFGFLGGSFVETSAAIRDPQCNTADNICEVKVITERSPHALTWTMSLAGGITVPMGTGYRFRMEARDLITALPVIDQPALIGANNQPVSTSFMRVKHIPIFTFGLDVLLERSHPRRY